MVDIVEGSLEAPSGGLDGTFPHGLSMVDRREFISNVLITKRVIVTKDNSTNGVTQNSKCDLVLPPVDRNTLCTPDAAPSEGQASCAICIMEYQDKDEICWSHNERCTHVFHRECIMTWLLRHDECPCCRHDFLSLENDEENPLPIVSLSGSDDVTISSAEPMTPSFQRGMMLFQHLGQSSGTSHSLSNPNLDTAQTSNPQNDENAQVAFRFTAEDEYSLEDGLNEVASRRNTDIIFSEQEDIFNAIHLTMLEDSLLEIGDMRYSVDARDMHIFRPRTPVLATPKDTFQELGDKATAVAITFDNQVRPSMTTSIVMNELPNARTNAIHGTSDSMRRDTHGCIELASMADRETGFYGATKGSK